MRHLNAETLARIADGPTTEAEAAHLGACDACRAEVAAYRAQGSALGALPDPSAPPEVWAGLETRLGGLRENPAARPLLARLPRPALQAAAAVVLFAAGALAGARAGGGGPAAPDA
ncbi:MAG TPA: hypothetical protein VM778_14280, partial [Gemmatimonadota bacterium]|nr:hypothetical protein [Gemmatimonadota bacterium]